MITDFTAAARAWPDRTAVVHNGSAISYREFAGRVRGTARRYRSVGIDADGSVGPIGALVAPEPAVGQHLLAILQARATYCPIDATQPIARQEVLAAALGLDRLFAVAAHRRGPANLQIDRLADYPPRPDAELPQAKPGDPAYALCTSGSTGSPKPVLVPHGALAVTVRALRKLFELTPEDRVLQFASLGWDTCLEEILPALTAGAALVFDDAAHSGSFQSFIRMLTNQKITVVDLPTAFWHEFVLFLSEEPTTLPESLRLVVIGGERVDPTRLRQWRALPVGRIRLLNTYGCTETTMVTHAVQLSGPGTEPGIEAGEVPMGRPLPHVRDHVTEGGELLVSGPGLATGYLGLPNATAAGFEVADHGWGPDRWFHTGDLVHRGRNGLLYSRGRADEQVKVLGVRVHPAEVEEQLNAHPAVGGAVVVGERSLGRTSLTAYVVPAALTTAEELQRYLRLRLPSQFVPSKVTFVSALSYTVSGKVDRAATRCAAAHSNV
ncbi:AMP-binding protein [Mycolicibacterium fallax]|uniref:Acyl-CoA synthetase n=1 Tax=Mycolicibacterium fallax TaxID=1793 RepID=A0A1X1RHA7_MYCFA|nr:AMP-binding protein [Mycolicibacterium fallax]ORV05662.1 acyl-CoA synthetase [Mycolicibacterium fallax]BBY99840.1 hypothetical protein MFAL_33070 [Mycolicibacterium fallax]